MLIFGVFFFLLLSFSFLFLSKTFFPPIWPDEVLFYSPALSISHGEGLATRVLSGLIEGMDKSTLWMPPIYFLYSSLFIKTFGPYLLSVRIGSFLAGIVCLIPLIGIGKKFGLNQKSLFFLSSLVLTDFLYLKISSTARMESLCLLFNLFALFLLVTDISNHKKFILAGFLFGMGIITHPFAIVFLPIGLLFLHYKGTLRIKIFFLLGLGAILPILAWSLYIIPNFNLFVLQFGAQLGRKKDLLFSVFTLFTKVKIILSGFKFPLYKLSILIFLIFGIFVLYRKYLSNKPINSLILVNVTSIIVVLFFLFLSSESWYVFYLIPFICLLTAILFEFGDKFFKFISISALLYNIIVIILFINNNFITNDTAAIQENYFNEIYNKCKDKKKIYLQAIPDPYFYLTERDSKLEIREFIPGELPLPEEFSRAELTSQDVYIFYNEDLVHPTVKKYLNDNQNLFERSEINIQPPSKIDLSFFAIVYKKK